MLCVKTIRDMTAKLQDGYKNNAMQVNPKHKWCMEKSIFLKIEQFNAETPQSTIFYEWNAWVWD